LICAKFDANLIVIFKGTNRKTEWFRFFFLLSLKSFERTARVLLLTEDRGMNSTDVVNGINERGRDRCRSNSFPIADIVAIETSSCPKSARIVHVFWLPPEFWILGHRI